MHTATLQTYIHITRNILSQGCKCDDIGRQKDQQDATLPEITNTFMRDKR